MSVIKCKMCGGAIEFEHGSTVGTCKYCGTKQTLPRLDDDRRSNLYDRASHFRRNNDFDKASSIYEQILTEDTTDAEAYWSLVLCRYGIEYVEDPATHKRVPTVNRAQFTSIFDDDNYKSAVRYADSCQRELYEEEAKEINEIQKGILAISQNEEPFDVFICYKETDNNGRRTPDSVLANDLYHQLTQEGFKVFFARITLEDKLGTAYEPYIFAALNSAKVMVVLGTRAEYFNAPWVKNEWSRYLALIRTAGGMKVLIPAYRDMDPYDLPDEFSHLQALDMSKLGFMQDLIRGIKKLTQTDEPKTTVKETVTGVSGSANVAPLLERAFLFLEDGKWQDADIYCEKVLDIDPKNAEAYLGKLMAELHVRTRKQLADCADPFDDKENYGKVLRFGDEKLETEMRGYITHINERNESERLTRIYNSAVSAMKSANSETAFKSAANKFRAIPGFKDADALAQQCLDKAEVCYKDSIYTSAKAKISEAERPRAGLYESQKYKVSIDTYEEAIKIFSNISGWKDADEQIYACQRKIEEIRAKEEADRLERERQTEQKRIAAEKAAKKRKKIAAIATPIVVACIAFVIVLTMVIIPNIRYNSAVDLYNAGKYDEAIAAFTALNGYKDSVTQITRCETAIKDIKYNAALDLYNSGKYDEAFVAFQALNGYKDSAEQITKCENAIKDDKYNAALELYNAGKYDEAITAFTALNGYKDSTERIVKCETAIKYNDAIKLFEKGDIVNAYESLSALNGYKDSTEKANAIFGKYKIEKLKSAIVGDIVYFGTYEQDNKTDNGKEDIEWIVLAKDGDRVLVISKYALDCQQYNSSRAKKTWETCSLRKWLNETFTNAAFSLEEQKNIINSTVTVGKNPSNNTSSDNNTTDKVFLLSTTEAIKYFKSDYARKCAPTDYAIAQGAYINKNYTTDGRYTCWWWLRTNDFGSLTAYSVHSDGSVTIYGDYVDRDQNAVRPAMWISVGD